MPEPIHIGWPVLRVPTFHPLSGQPLPDDDWDSEDCIALDRFNNREHVIEQYRLQWRFMEACDAYQLEHGCLAPNDPRHNPTPTEIEVIPPIVHTRPGFQYVCTLASKSDTEGVEAILSTITPEQLKALQECGDNFIKFFP